MDKIINIKSSVCKKCSAASLSTPHALPHLVAFRQAAAISQKQQGRVYCSINTFIYHNYVSYL